MTENNHGGWFLARPLSETSSTTDRLLVALKRCDREVLIGIGFDIAALGTVLAYVSRFKTTEALVEHDAATRVIRYNISLMREDETHVGILKTQLDGHELPIDTIRTYVKVLGGNSSARMKYRTKALITSI